MKNAWRGRQPGQAKEKKLRALSTPAAALPATVTRRNAARNAPPTRPDDGARRRFDYARHRMFHALAWWLRTDPAIAVTDLEIADTYNVMRRLAALSRELP
jgi:hypothetical protein